MTSVVEHFEISFNAVGAILTFDRSFPSGWTPLVNAPGTLTVDPEARTLRLIGGSAGVDFGPVSVEVCDGLRDAPMIVVIEVDPDTVEMRQYVVMLAK